MIYEIKEKHKLPLTFKFVDEYKATKGSQKVAEVPYATSKSLKTEFLMLVKPYKPLSRML